MNGLDRTNAVAACRPQTAAPAHAHTRVRGSQVHRYKRHIHTVAEELEGESTRLVRMPKLARGRNLSFSFWLLSRSIP